MSAKHPQTQRPSDKDLRQNPGIGTSKGTIKDGDVLDGDNTFEGDIANDTNPQGGIDPNRTGRTNK